MSFSFCPGGCASCRTPVGGSHPPRRVPHAKKKPVLAYELFLKYGGEGGIDSLRSPLLGPSMGLAPAGPTQALFKNAPGVFVGAARSQARGLSNWRCQLSNPGRGFSSPPAENIKEKSLYLRTGSHLEYGGEGGIRTPDTLPYTHFPGVLLQPLGHLTILSCCSPWVGNGALL
ncbi:Ybl54 [Klebsiella quasipneumoniae subsp. quasipneumoniae]|nr:Ybl54 [Klebsiella quasipneumoniae subsp. quasipneumoniae]